MVRKMSSSLVFVSRLYLIIIFFFIFPVDFVKFFQNGDHSFHQDREIKYSQDDAIKYSQDDAHHGYAGQETSEATVRDENCCENTLSSVNITCPGNMKSDINT